MKHRHIAVGIASIAVALTATSGAHAYVQSCSGPAANGCTPPGGDHTYVETRSSKSGGAASYICTYLVAGSTVYAAACPSNATFIRQCYYGGALVHGFHSGSSNAWNVDGRDATSSDATTC